MILNRLQWDSVRLKSLGLCHYSVLLATRGAGAEGAAHRRADAASRLWVCGQSRVSSGSPPTHYSLDSQTVMFGPRGMCRCYTETTPSATNLMCYPYIESPPHLQKHVPPSL